LAAAGSARIMVFPPLSGSCLRVALWQWSLLSWLMTTISGSGISRREEIQGSVFCFVIENLGWKMLEGPDSHGSRRMVKACEDRPGEGGKEEIGWKVRRKDASELRCLIVRDILDGDRIDRTRRWRDS
jgi:hypothetical protein